MKDRQSLSIYGSMLLVGASVGWLVGLSISPVVGSVVASVLVVATAALAAAMGVRDSSAGSYTVRGYRFTVGPLAAFTIALALGAGIGVVARTRHWLEPSPDTIIKEWEKRGLDRQEVTTRLFEALYPAGAGKKGGSSSSAAARGVLFQISADECQRLQTLPGSALSAELRTTHDAKLRSLAETITDEGTLRALIDALCTE